MAEHELIDGYLEHLRRSLRRHRDVDDLIDEVADHLHARTSQHLELGLEPEAAQRRTLAAFGDHQLVARTYVEQREAGLAIPTRYTRTAGTLLVAAGAAWLVAFGLFIATSIADRTRPWEGLPQVLFATGAWILLAGAIASWPGLVGVYRRHGGGGRLQVAALVLMGLGALAGFAPWFVVGWIPLLAAGGVLFAVWLRRRDLAPRVPALLLGAGPAAALAVVVAVLATIGFDGTPNHRLAVRVVLYGVLAMFAAGWIGLGRWLRSEEPVDDPEQALIA